MHHTFQNKIIWDRLRKFTSSRRKQIWTSLSLGIRKLKVTKTVFFHGETIRTWFSVMLLMVFLQICQQMMMFKFNAHMHAHWYLHILFLTHCEKKSVFKDYHLAFFEFVYLNWKIWFGPFLNVAKNITLKLVLTKSKQRLYYFLEFWKLNKLLRILFSFFKFTL